MFGYLWLLVVKDLRVDWRGGEHLPSLLLFVLLIWLIFAFAFGTQSVAEFRTTPLVIKRARLAGATPQQVKTLQSMEGERHLQPQSWVRAFNLAASQLQTSFSVPLDRATLLQWSHQTPLQRHTAGLLWMVLLLSGVLGLNRSLYLERQNHAWQALLMTPTPRPLLWLAKCVSNTLALSAVMMLAIIVSGISFQLSLLLVLPPLTLIIAGGILGFTALGSLLAALTTSLSGKEILLPLILYPLLMPLILSGVQSTQLVLDGYSLSQTQPWLALLFCSDILFLSCGFLLSKISFTS